MSLQYTPFSCLVLNELSGIETYNTFISGSDVATGYEEKNVCFMVCKMHSIHYLGMMDDNNYQK